MTDTLPRQIPTDPAEQERRMPKWVKMEWACRELRQPPLNHHHTGWPHALTIWQWCPEPVDPDLLIAREVCASVSTMNPASYLSGDHDCAHSMQACLAAIKRVRALARGEG